MRSAARLAFHPSRLPSASHLPPFFILALLSFCLLFPFSTLSIFSLSLSFLSAHLRFHPCQLTVSHLPLSSSPHSPASLSLGARPRHTCPRQPLLVFPTLLTTSPPALIVRYCPSFQQRYRQTLPSSADRASWGAARALTLGQHGFGSMFGSKEIGSKSSSGTFLCLDCERWSCSRLSLALSPRCSGQWQWEKKLVGGALHLIHHWSRKSTHLPTALSIPPPKLLPDLKRGQKKGQKLPPI